MDKTHGGYLLGYLEDSGDAFLSAELKAALSLASGQTNMERAMVRARRNLVQVSVLFNSNNGRRFVRDVRMTYADMVGSIGGSLGLFTGFSILSICELLYYLGRIVTAARGRRGGCGCGGKKR